jgi:hypothetical protein
LYRESQGIVDIVVKLVVLAQFRAITLGEVHGAEERLSAGVLEQVARDEFKLIRPMIDALRSGRADALDSYADLTPLQRHVEEVLARATDVSVKEMRERLAAEGAPPTCPADRDAPSAAIRCALEGMGIGGDVIGQIMAEVQRRHPSGDLFRMMDTARELAEGAKKKRPARGRPRGQRAAQESAADPLDLRGAASGAPQPGAAHDALASAGHVSTVAEALKG